MAMPKSQTILHCPGPPGADRFQGKGTIASRKKKKWE
jgi:hypothetical protein